ncbi:hypothetical protein EJ06DRAFT_433878 [Trichodelitschia bisporula]|uniref:Myb-like domain-containing protein n=1 Tax=Trichodelitschia bisporula TaxID=703511 RepID=A0A6G1HXE3_9PEZI|nr:hypothetical protein EJ06DRAFT_433878 [Trichodelitschia bisporula]
MPAMSGTGGRYAQEHAPFDDQVNDRNEYGDHDGPHEDEGVQYSDGDDHQEGDEAFDSVPAALTSDDLAQKRHENDKRLKSAFDAIYEKYGRDFTNVADEIDLVTGEVVVNNGHLDSMHGEPSGLFVDGSEVDDEDDAQVGEEGNLEDVGDNHNQYPEDNFADDDESTAEPDRAPRFSSVQRNSGYPGQQSTVPIPYQAPQIPMMVDQSVAIQAFSASIAAQIGTFVSQMTQAHLAAALNDQRQSQLRIENLQERRENGQHPRLPDLRHVQGRVQTVTPSTGRPSVLRSREAPQYEDDPSFPPTRGRNSGGQLLRNRPQSQFRNDAPQATPTFRQPPRPRPAAQRPRERLQSYEDVWAEPLPRARRRRNHLLSQNAQERDTQSRVRANGQGLSQDSGQQLLAIADPQTQASEQSAGPVNIAPRPLAPRPLAPRPLAPKPQADATPAAPVVMSSTSQAHASVSSLATGVPIAQALADLSTKATNGTSVQARASTPVPPNSPRPLSHLEVLANHRNAQLLSDQAVTTATELPGFPTLNQPVVHPVPQVTTQDATPVDTPIADADSEKRRKELKAAQRNAISTTAGSDKRRSLDELAANVLSSQGTSSGRQARDDGHRSGKRRRLDRRDSNWAVPDSEEPADLTLSQGTSQGTSQGASQGVSQESSQGPSQVSSQGASQGTVLKTPRSSFRQRLAGSLQQSSLPGSGRKRPVIIADGSDEDELGLLAPPSVRRSSSALGSQRSDSRLEKGKDKATPSKDKRKAANGTDEDDDELSRSQSQSRKDQLSRSLEKGRKHPKSRVAEPLDEQADGNEPHDEEHLRDTNPIRVEEQTRADEPARAGKQRRSSERLRAQEQSSHSGHSRASEPSHVEEYGTSDDDAVDLVGGDEVVRTGRNPSEELCAYEVPDFLQAPAQYYGTWLEPEDSENVGGVLTALQREARQWRAQGSQETVLEEPMQDETMNEESDQDDSGHWGDVSGMWQDESAFEQATGQNQVTNGQRDLHSRSASSDSDAILLLPHQRRASNANSVQLQPATRDEVPIDPVLLACAEQNAPDRQNVSNGQESSNRQDTSNRQVVSHPEVVLARKDASTRQVAFMRQDTSNQHDTSTRHDGSNDPDASNQQVAARPLYTDPRQFPDRWQLCRGYERLEARLAPRKQVQEQLQAAEGNTTDGGQNTGADQSANGQSDSNSRPARKKRKAATFTPEEDRLLCKLFEEDNMPWLEILSHFPGRTMSQMHYRYHFKLRYRPENSHLQTPDDSDTQRRADDAAQVEEATSGPAAVTLSRSRFRKPGRLPTYQRQAVRGKGQPAVLRDAPDPW